MIFENVRDALAKQFEIDPETITMDTSIVDDLGADSSTSLSSSCPLRICSAYPSPTTTQPSSTPCAASLSIWKSSSN